MSSVDKVNSAGKPRPSRNSIRRNPRKVARYGARFVEVNRRRIEKELGRPLKKLSRAEKTARRKLIREQRRLEKEIQASQSAQEASIPREKVADMYDIVVEIAREAESSTDPAMSRNLTQLTTNLLKIIDEYHERESERLDEEHRQDRIDDERDRKKRVQEKLAKEKVEKDTNFDNRIRDEIRETQSTPKRPKKRTRI